MAVLPAYAAPEAAASPTQSPAAGDAAAAEWRALEQQAKPQQPPAEIQQKGMESPEGQKWVKEEVERLKGVGEKAREFYSRHPDDPNAKQARLLERMVLEIRARFGDAGAKADLAKREEELLQLPSITKQERFQIRAQQVLRNAKNAGDLETGARELLAEFPGEPQVYQLLLIAAMQSNDPERTRAMVEDIRKSNAPEQVKAQAEGMMKTLDAVGKPFELKFTALDGREVDVQKMKGKVVLIDFWAMWCQPCVAEIPKIREAYKELNGKGFEIVGINLDSDKEPLEKFLKENGMTWPQYFDGKRFETEPARRFGISMIPTMWLVDKKGILRVVNARSDLKGSVEKLLAE